MTIRGATGNSWRAKFPKLDEYPQFFNNIYGLVKGYQTGRFFGPLLLKPALF